MFYFPLEFGVHKSAKIQHSIEDVFLQQFIFDLPTDHSIGRFYNRASYPITLSAVAPQGWAWELGGRRFSMLVAHVDRVRGAG